MRSLSNLQNKDPQLSGVLVVKERLFMPGIKTGASVLLYKRYVATQYYIIVRVSGTKTKMVVRSCKKDRCNKELVCAGE